MYYAFATLITLYSTLAVVLLMTHFYLKRAHGIAGATEKINTLARTKKIVVFEIYSYLTVGIWVALALPWIDLFTFGWFTHIKDGGLESYFGRMTSHDASIYFVVVVLMNIIGAKAAMTLAELAGLLRKGRVRMVTHGPFWVFMPER